MNKIAKNLGFSLVELSLVLVVLGLIAGGVVAGKSLIRAAELRGVPTELQQFDTAFTMFEDKYAAFPGDMNNATSYWTGGVTANGNSDGIVHDDVAANAFSERNMIWQHMALAGFLNGNYTGRDGNANHHSIIGTNVPASKVKGAGWSIDTTWNSGWPSNSYQIPPDGRVHFLVFGSVSGNSLTNQTVFTPEEAWNIDKKMDDGVAGRGRALAYPRNNNCALAASDTDYDAAYSLSTTTKSCGLYFPRPFGDVLNRP